MKALALTMIFGVVFMVRTCPKYTCNENTTNVGECAKTFTYNISMTTCKNGFICRLFKNATGACKNVTLLADKLPGEYCASPTECRSGNCTNSACFGIPDNKCKTHADCNVEHFCFEGSCTKATSVCAEARPFCKSNEICHLTKCIPLGSIKTGGEAYSPAACETYYIKGNNCAKGPELINDNKNGTCEYQLDKERYTTTALCSKNKEGSYYCPEGLGDIKISAVNLLLTLVYQIYELYQKT